MNPSSTVSRILKRDMVLGVLAVALFALPLLFIFLCVSRGVWRWDYLGVRLVTAGAGVLTILFALPSALTFVNRSSLAQTYAARLVRPYPAPRTRFVSAQGMNVTEVIPGDDVSSIIDYKPHVASGPLHIINLTVNQTVDKASLLRKRDRQGDIVAISCLGMTVGEKWHCTWIEPKVPRSARKVHLGINRSVDCRAEHPLVDALDRSATSVEPLSLRQWVGISGAVIDSGRGQSTNRGLALLFGMTNLRTGHWWDSGIAASSRFGFPELTFLRRSLLGSATVRHTVPFVVRVDCWLPRTMGAFLASVRRRLL